MLHSFPSFSDAVRYPANDLQSHIAPICEPSMQMLRLVEPPIRLKGYPELKAKQDDAAQIRDEPDQIEPRPVLKKKMPQFPVRLLPV